MELNKNNLNEYYNDEESFIIPDKFTSMGDCFSGCHSLKEITISNSVISIGHGCFTKCESLEKIIIPNSVTSIGDYCFYGCESLEEITIPDSITSIGEFCFEWCESLEKITIPNSVTSLEDSCFQCCLSLKEIIIPDEPSMELLKELINQNDLNLNIVHTVNNVDISDKINFAKMYI